MNKKQIKQGIQNIGDLIKFHENNPNGICWSTGHYIDVKRVVKILDEVRINKALGADGEMDKFIIEFFSQSVFPGQ